MESLLRDLGVLLAQQVENLKALETLMQNQQKALVRRDVPGILESISGQEACLARIREMEADRAGLMEKISGVLGLGLGGITLKELTENLEPEVGTELRATGRAIRETLENIGRVNSENRRLIEHSLEFVQEMLGALTGAAPTGRTYEASGNLKARSQDHSLVDQVT
ncbi:MAG: flagellar protein FlgN [Candidatus Eisenbacteria sp.]|nr:flagellar protein FlgN [Candidatus Eisenbacteria bacterium]